MKQKTYSVSIIHSFIPTQVVDTKEHEIQLAQQQEQQGHTSISDHPNHVGSNKNDNIETRSLHSMIASSNSSSCNNCKTKRIVYIELPENGIECIAGSRVGRNQDESINMRSDNSNKKNDTIEKKNTNYDNGSNIDDYDNSSWSTIDSLLSADESENGSPLEDQSNYKGGISTTTATTSSSKRMERLETKFRTRSQQLKQLERRIRRKAEKSIVPICLDQYYLETLKANEETVRQKYIEDFYYKEEQYKEHGSGNQQELQPQVQKHAISSPSSSSSQSPSQSSTFSSILMAKRPSSIKEQIQRDLLFEVCHGAPGLTIVVLNVLSYISFYKVFHVGLYYLHYYVLSEYMNESVFFGLCIIIGLFIMRASGYVWRWVSDESSYEALKFELHNRIRLGYWDTKLFAYLKKTKSLFSYLNMSSFYLIYVGIYYFYEILLTKIVNATVLEWHNGIMEIPLQQLSMTIDDDWQESETICEKLSNHLYSSSDDGGMGGGIITRITNEIGIYLCNEDQDMSSVHLVMDAAFFIGFAQVLLWYGFDFMTSLD